MAISYLPRLGHPSIWSVPAPMTEASAPSHGCSDTGGSGTGKEVLLCLTLVVVVSEGYSSRDLADFADLGGTGFRDHNPI